MTWHAPLIILWHAHFTNDQNTFCLSNAHLPLSRVPPADLNLLWQFGRFQVCIRSDTCRRKRFFEARVIIPAKLPSFSLQFHFKFLTGSRRFLRKPEKEKKIKNEMLKTGLLGNMPQADVPIICAQLRYTVV